MNTSNTQALPTSVTSKGQVTIPAEIREYLGIKPRDKVQFEVDADGSVRVSPAPSRLSAVFASVKPSTVHKDDATLRREFEEGVAEEALRRG
jgi:AbrB family looped-hinge helix DNA binding protein